MKGLVLHHLSRARRGMTNNVSDFIGPIAIVSPQWGEPGAVPDWTCQNDGFCSWERLISETV
jgi:hypothetical protein